MRKSIRRRRAIAAFGVGCVAAGAVIIGVTAVSPAGDERAGDVASAAQSGASVVARLERTSADVSAEVRAQLDYVLANFSAHSSERYGYIPEYDCANFASQSLIARGWSPDEDWWFASDALESSSSWRSSTALREYLLGRGEVRELSDADRGEVRLGDIVQFDWDNSGDRDHTGIVTRIERLSDGSTRVFYAGHTDDTDFRSVDSAITELHPGASAYYLAIDH